MKKINVFNKLENLVKRNAKFNKEDLVLDKEKILKEGTGKYYFLTRESGTVLVTEFELSFNKRAKEVWNYYLDRDSSSRIYMIDVAEIDGKEAIGTVKNLRNAALYKAA